MDYNHYSFKFVYDVDTLIESLAMGARMEGQGTPHPPDF